MPVRQIVAATHFVRRYPSFLLSGFVLVGILRSTRGERGDVSRVLAPHETCPFDVLRLSRRCCRGIAPVRSAMKSAATSIPALVTMPGMMRASLTYGFCDTLQLPMSLLVAREFPDTTISGCSANCSIVGLVGHRPVRWTRK